MTDESEEARMRALFADMSRPPMGDEDFVRSVMGRVQEVRAADLGRRQAGLIGAVAAAGAILWPFKDAIGAAATLSTARYLPDVSTLGGGAAALIVAAAVSLAAWTYAERG